MKASRWLLLAGALALSGTVAGLWSTRAPAPATSKDAATRPASGATGPAPNRPRVVDMSPLLTARRVAALATTPEEQELARQAERLADHSVDLAFVDAMRRAVDEQPPPTPEVRELAARKSKARAAVEAGEQRVAQLTREAAAASPEDKEQRLDEVEVARAQLELDRDELGAASDALERAGGDPQARIKRLKEAYEAAQKEPRAAAAVASGGPPASLVGKLRAWSDQRAAIGQLAQAQREAREKAQLLGGWKQRLAAQLQPGAPPPAGGVAPPAAAIHRRLGVIAQRIQNQQDLADVYADWASLAEARARSVLHALLVGVLLALLVLAATFGASLLLDRALRRKEGDEFRRSTLRTVAKAAVQLAGVLVVLFMLLGVPAQATTILGLAGAGLTVAMKDFIVAFFGWFILMGRNGIRVGDWVEINGVGGEVAEIGLLRTVLLETGSWSDAGHPTGRRVSFVNSFAIERHFFNFSTSGQWMWDELRVLIPLGQDPYPIIDGVQKLARQETAANAKLAEQEWLKATTKYRVRTFSAEPGINVIPTSSGVEVDVRYITRAFERHDSRRRLYDAIIALMHGKRTSGEVVGAA
ncbi:mechanosensitive ion channel domain-containing protein [Anaeromyxobacter paludicola]|uniref:Mechanosensitive ion channel MscS domain-containing protein n=1 Tax=Anaeromyxobacter paludicola TaxID=2918171 RepID=A0ABN6N954_9BACT|nr:mechanosensitive ion channel domain-containing protein [Anaeromyxobacter paludicola]BDG08550.1 hypothetical protein AMPC_16630 [Anaeromyxobacter paludicola]